jgi:hypothetical protein
MAMVSGFSVNQADLLACHDLSLSAKHGRKSSAAAPGAPLGRRRSVLDGQDMACQVARVIADALE